MLTDATRRYRDVLAVGLLVVAGLYFIAALSMLFRSDPVFAGPGGGFADSAALSGYLFTSVVPVGCLVLAALLTTRYGDPGPASRLVVLAALGLAGLDGLFALITFFAQFGSDLGYGFAGTLAGGAFSGAVIGLAHLVLLAAAALYLYSALRSLPAAAPAAQPQWGAPGIGGPAWGSPGTPPGAVPQAWPQQAPTYGWGRSDQGQHPAWGAPTGPAAEAPYAPGGWGAPAAAGWHDPAAAQQGQPASSWSRAGQEWGVPAAPPAAPAEHEQQPAGASAWTPPPAAPAESDGPDDSVGDERSDAVPTAAPEPDAGADDPAQDRSGWWRRTDT